MRAIILAAGRGMRLQQLEDEHFPKCLLRFGGMSLMERHLRLQPMPRVLQAALGDDRNLWGALALLRDYSGSA